MKSLRGTIVKDEIESQGNEGLDRDLRFFEHAPSFKEGRQEAITRPAQVSLP